MKIIAIVMGLLFTSTTSAMTTIWTDCSSRLYQLPYNINESEAFRELVTDQMVRDYAELNARKVAEAEELISKNASIETEGLSEDQLKVLAKNMMADVAKLATLRKYHHFNDLEMARTAYYFSQYLSAADQILKEQGIEAVFVPTALTTCEVDVDLMDKILKRAYENIQQLKRGATNA